MRGQRPPQKLLVSALYDGRSDVESCAGCSCDTASQRRSFYRGLLLTISGDFRELFLGSLQPTVALLPDAFRDSLTASGGNLPCTFRGRLHTEFDYVVCPVRGRSGSAAALERGAYQDFLPSTYGEIP
jgi:hypothetical protein